MNITTGVIHHGRVEIEEPIDLPDGTKVSLAISELRETEVDSDDSWDHSPAGIADWLSWYDSLQPLVITKREEAEAEDWLRQINSHGAANLSSSTLGLFQ